MRTLQVGRATTCLLLISFTFLLCGCGTTSSQSKVTKVTIGSLTPVVTEISPNTAAVGSSATTITVTGSNFTSSSTLMWNGTSLPTTVTNSTTVTAQVPATDLAASGTALVTVMTPPPGGGVSNGVTFTIQTPNPVPTLTSLSQSGTTAGSPAITLTVTGTNFVQSSTVLWNGSPLSTSYTSATTLTAQVPATDLATAGTLAVTVSNPAPAGGISNAVNFTIAPGPQVVNVLANDLAWDSVNQVIYLSLPSTDPSNGNSVQILNPITGTLGSAVLAGSEPDLLSVSATSQLLYVSQDGAPTVEVMTLPSLISASTINLGSSSTYGPYYAMDVQAAPNADSTVAIVLGTPGYSPQEEGGVIIYDNGTARTNVICGWIETGCPNPNIYLMDSIQWKSDGSEMYAANYESSGFDFYTIPVTASGFGSATDYPGDVPGYFYRIHYDAPTGYVYDDDGGVVNPSNGAIVGTFSASGLMVPDGTMGTAFFLGQTQQQAGSTAYTIESFNIQTFAAVNTYTIFNVVGTPTHLIRWGTNGLAFTTVDTTQSPAVGDVYLISGSFVSRSAKRAVSLPENVQRTWKPKGRDSR